MSSHLKPEEICAKGGCSGALNVEETAALESQILKIASQEGINCQFMGKIYGKSNDYLIVCGLEKLDLKYLQKKFFFCMAPSYELQELPLEEAKLLEERDEKFQECLKALSAKRLEGDPSRPLFESEEDEESGPKEIHRLALIVNKIDTQTTIIPRGSYIVSPEHFVLPNPMFRGICAELAFDLNMYHHFCGNAVVDGICTKEGLIKDDEFLMVAGTGKPNCVWNIRKSECNQFVQIRNYIFPGHHFVHKVGTKEFGNVYFGYGLENFDFAFMV